MSVWAPDISPLARQSNGLLTICERIVFLSSGGHTRNPVTCACSFAVWLVPYRFSFTAVPVRWGKPERTPAASLISFGRIGRARWRFTCFAALGAVRALAPVDCIFKILAQSLRPETGSRARVEQETCSSPCATRSAARQCSNPRGQ